MIWSSTLTAHPPDPPSGSVALRHLVFGRASNCSLPSLSFSLLVDTVDGGRPRANAKLSVAPMEVVLVPSFLSAVTASVTEGAVARLPRLRTLLPRPLILPPPRLRTLPPEVAQLVGG